MFGLFKKKAPTANLAKERLKIIVEHRRDTEERPDFLAQMQREILQVVKKYVDIDLDDIHADITEKGESEVLELNVTLPEKGRIGHKAEGA